MSGTSHRTGPLTNAEIGDRLRKARQAAGVTQSEAAATLSVSRPTLVAIETGRRRFKAEELRLLAERYGTGVNRILSPSAVHLNLVARFRGLAGRNPSETAPTLLLLNKLASAMVELERLLGLQPPAILVSERRIDPVAVDRQAEEAALTVRYSLGLGLSPVPHLVEVLEDQVGVRIFVRDLPGAISGVFAHDPEVGACVLLNAHHSSQRHAMTAAHELGHLVSNRSFGDIVESEERGAASEERFANVFAYAFLMPAAPVRRRFQDLRAAFDKFTLRGLVSMARGFYVSTQAMCRRLESLDLLPAGTFDSLRDRGFQEKDFDDEPAGEPGAQRPPRYGMRLEQLAAAALRRELLSEGQVARMLDLDRVEVRKIVGDSYGAGEVDIEVADHRAPAGRRA